MKSPLIFTLFTCTKLSCRLHHPITTQSQSLLNSYSRKNELDSRNRRKAIDAVFNFFLYGISLTGNPALSQAACLSGDPSPECIGVYKVPLDDAIKSYIDTPEHLARFAPDLRWVPLTDYPKSPKLAKVELVAMHERIQNIISMVTKGDFTGAGVEILTITPRIFAAGSVIYDHLQTNSSTEIIAMRSENATNELLYSLGSSDIILGQALAGRQGVIVTQLQVLEDLRNAETSLNELLRAIPEEW